jgi:hypothetical protein
MAINDRCQQQNLSVIRQMKIHDLSSWEEISDTLRHSDDETIRLIIRKAEEVVSEYDDQEDRIQRETKFENLDELIDNHSELIEIKDLFFETLKISKNADEKTVRESLDAFEAAYSDLKALDAVVVANLPFLTSGSPVDQVQHEFDRMKELHADEIKRVTFERDFFKMMAGFN